MEIKRRDRLINISTYLLEHPNHPVTLKSFIEKYNCAKSSLSKDVVIIKNNFAKRGLGRVRTQVGATGGLTYTPYVNHKQANKIISVLIARLNHDQRYLPGGYIYMSDLLSQPYLLSQISKVIATQYLNKHVDYVLTMSGKGAIAPAVAKALGTPFIETRHDSKISDGATINVNYFSVYTHQMRQLVLPQRSLQPDKNVLIVDDYLKGGSTISGMAELIKAFHCHLAGIDIFADGSKPDAKLDLKYHSLVKINTNNNKVSAEPGNLYQK